MEKLDYIANVRLTSDQRQRAELMAAASGLTFSELIRTLLNSAQVEVRVPTFNGSGNQNRANVLQDGAVSA